MPTEDNDSAVPIAVLWHIITHIVRPDWHKRKRNEIREGKRRNAMPKVRKHLSKLY